MGALAVVLPESRPIGPGIPEMGEPGGVTGVPPSAMTASIPNAPGVVSPIVLLLDLRIPSPRLALLESRARARTDSLAACFYSFAGALLPVASFVRDVPESDDAGWTGTAPDWARI